MAFKVYSENDIPGREWNTLTGDSFFSSPDFASLWRAKRGEPVFCLDETNGKIWAGMAGIIFGKHFAKRYDSMPDGFFGGPYFAVDCDDTLRHKFMISCENYLKSGKIIRAFINKPTVELKSDMFRPEQTTSHILQMSGDNYSPPRREVRKHIRGSRERGGRVERFVKEDDLERFYELAVATKKRHGQKPAYPAEFFYRLLKIATRSTGVLWLKVMLGEKMIASQITFIEREDAFNWQFYYDKKYSYYKPGYLLLDYAIDFSIKKGIKHFSLGSTPGNLPSLILYKERWGGRETVYPYYTYYSRLGRMLYRWGRK